ncbi:hypothetical protein CAC42_4332 [Sphaceloma murrayae]|uniref:Xylanolytic transcriptional activator regulatory domain-containing protein n=1 Tax=Sphaceloma murrayae TaxID=2082308 RepID=A0A2K1QLT3_9PEZI|nr:hypothetical protein CAC42_4332 [Sphaceloma murrayae]
MPSVESSEASPFPATNSAGSRIAPEESTLPPDVDEFLFLEQSFLPNFEFDPGNLYQDDSALTFPVSKPGRLHPEILLERTEPSTPAPSDGSEAIDNLGGRPGELALRSGLVITEEEVDAFTRQLRQVDTYGRLRDFVPPSKARLSRCLSAYFDYFDPHAPIIHRPTFNLRNSHPFLVLAVAAIGAMYTREQTFAFSAYEITYQLLLDFEGSQAPRAERDLWPAQTTILCIHMGALSDSKVYLQQAERQLSLVAILLRDSVEDVSDLHDQRGRDWAVWIFLETYFRLAAWKMVLNAVILSVDPEAISITAQQESKLSFPCHDSVWSASDEAEWHRQFLAHGGTFEADVSAVSQALMSGSEVYANINAFGLLAVVGALLAHICCQERLQVGISEGLELATITRLEQTLRIWETTWKRHPEARRQRRHRQNPLLADSLGLLASCYYHLYVGSELRQLKKLSRMHDARVLSGSTPLPVVRQPSLAFKAIRYAAHSWSVRLKLGIAHLSTAAPLEHGSQILVTAYEAALILSWWTFRLQTDRYATLGSISDGEMRALDDMFRGISRDLEEQDLCDPQTPMWMRPLISTRHMIMNGVWTCSDKLGKYLDTFGDHLQAIDHQLQMHALQRGSAGFRDSIGFQV